MANDTNVVVLVGRLTRDSELRFTKNGAAVCHFSLAVNRIKGSKDQREDEVSYIDVSMWGKMAESLHPYMTKGHQVCITGELRQNRWEQDGQSRNKVEVVANTVQLLGNATQSRETASFNEGSTRSQEEEAIPPAFEFPGPEQFDDDIPF